MITEPNLKHRPEQHYVAIRTRVPIPFGALLPPLWDEVRNWLAGRNLAAGSAPFIHYLTKDMTIKLDIEVGFPLETPTPGIDRVTAGVLPSGRYAMLVYTRPYEGDGVYKANVALMDWAKANDIIWQTNTIDGIVWWGGRFESYLTAVTAGIDSQKWQTELAILLAEG